jgi:hypothetical protein
MPRAGVRMHREWFHDPPGSGETYFSVIFRDNDRHGIFPDVLAGDTVAVGMHIVYNLNNPFDN